MAPPFAKVEFDLMYGEGISAEGDLVDLATKYELIEKSGAWYSYNGERMGQGRDQAKNFLKENRAVGEELRRKILELNKIGVISAATLVDGKGSSVEGAADESVERSTKEAAIKKSPAVAAAVSAKKAVRTEAEQH